MPIKVVKTEKTCPVCEKQFIVSPYQIKRNITTCSRECSNIYRSGERNPFFGKTLSEAQKENISLTNRRWELFPCSCGCGQEVRVPPWRKAKNMQHTFFVNKDHRWAYERGENSPHYRGDISRKGRGKGWPQLAKSVRDRDIVCQFCGKTREQEKKALHVHHIIPYRVSNDNSLSNLTLLCNSCHSKENKKESCLYPEHYPVAVKLVTCINCGITFEASSYHLKTCSDACRRKRDNQCSIRYHREQRKLKKLSQPSL